MSLQGYVAAVFPVLLPVVIGCGSAKQHLAAPLPEAPRVASMTMIATASSKATLKASAAWDRCHATFAVASSDVRAEVGRLSQGCLDVTRMHRVGDLFTSEQGAANQPQTFKWKAQAGHCYRVYGVGVPVIKNLSLLIEDSTGVVLGQDGTDNGSPVVPDSGAVCFKQDDDAAVVVSVGDGVGAYAVEVWGD